MKIDKRKKKNTTMRTDFMASKKQIAWRKKFAKLYGKKKKKSSKTAKKKVKKTSSKKKGLTLDERIFLRELKEARKYGTASASDIREINILERKLK